MKASRLALLAAQLFCAGLMSEAALAGNALSVWPDLWHTPDQQGQALLDAGQPAQAAARFHDPRRRAYADLQAGRYQEAAKLLAPFSDAGSEYNLGNALAKSGQLQAALAAYDAALKQAPADKDIRHNRDLVERALRQRRQSAQSSSRKGRQGGQGAGQQSQQSSGGQQGGSGSQRSGGSSQQSDSAAQQAGGASRQAGARGSQSAGGDPNGSQAGSNHSGNSGGQESGQGNDSQVSSAPQAAGSSGSSKEAPGQAQRDAALAAQLAREQGQRGRPGYSTQGQGSERNGASDLVPKNAGKAPGTAGLSAGGTQTPKQKPETERQLALDQWLRQIPDSPAGLLQRKFLIEHMMRQQGNDAPQGSEDQGTGP